MGQLRNSDDRHFRAVHHSLNLMDKLVIFTWLWMNTPKCLIFISNILKQNIPECDSCEAQGEELSILATGEKLGCRGWIIKQSISVSWVVPAADFI